MKKYVLSSVVFTCFSTAFAQNPWVQITENGLPPGVPSPLSEKSAFPNIQKIEEMRVKSFQKEFAAVLARHTGERSSHTETPGLVSSWRQLRITFTPIAAPAGDKEIGAAPAGTRLNNMWTGLDRYYSRPDGTLYKITEYDFKKTGGKFFMDKHATHIRIKGELAVSAITVLQDMQLDEVTWVRPQGIYTDVQLLRKSNEDNGNRNAPANQAVSVANMLN